MLEYAVIFIIVGAAGYYTINKLVSQARGKGCAGDCGCKCNSDESAA
jgi:hypothetical protein